MRGGKIPSRATVLRSGVAVKIMDGHSISDKELVEHLTSLGNDGGWKFQCEVLPRGGTDAGAFFNSRVVTLPVPVRYAHSDVEVASQDDITAAIDLLAAFLKTPMKIG